MDEKYNFENILFIFKKTVTCNLTMLFASHKVCGSNHIGANIGGLIIEKLFSSLRANLSGA